jgi:phosphoribosylaminoimidazole-succinocarboxamide synthase
MAIEKKNKPSKVRPLSRLRELCQSNKKVLFEGTEEGTHVLYFKDTLGIYDRNFGCSGSLNNRMSELFLSRIESIGVETHFIKRLSMCEQLVKALEVLPFSIRIHNFAFGDFAKRFNICEGTMFAEPILEFIVVDQEKKPHFVSTQQIVALGLADEEEIKSILEKVGRINDFMNGQFLALGMRLGFYKVEFGRLYFSDIFNDHKIILSDSFNMEDMLILDVESGYTQLNGFTCDEVAQRFGIDKPGGVPDLRRTFKNADS